MNREYPALTHRTPARGAHVATPAPPSQLTPESPALEAMTDLTQVRAVMIESHASLAACNSLMLAHAVRLLFVVDTSQEMVGVITATDLLGEKPMRFVQERGVTHHEILVADIMTPAAALEALDWQEVSHAQVGHIVATLKAVGRHHTFVTDEGGGRIRGIFSATAIGRSLGVELTTFEVAANFAQIEAALGR